MNKLTNEEVKKRRQIIEILRSEGGEELAIQMEKKLNKELDDNAVEGIIHYSQETEKWLKQIITQDKRMIELKDMVRSISTVEDTVLITGESGTGKELIAHALHGNRQGNFISVNCAGMPTDLIEAELFGYVRGAFTGADRDKMGLFEAAKKGTIFLDEIGDMPLMTQAKMLRMLEQKAYRKVGDNLEVKIDVRVVCATHHNLAQRVNEGAFRLDLYARIKTFPLITIPIRHRLEDVKLIVESMDGGVGAYEAIAKQFNGSIKSIESDNTEITWKDFWSEYPYAMNVRDIKSLVRQYIVLGRVI